MPPRQILAKVGLKRTKARKREPYYICEPKNASIGAILFSCAKDETNLVTSKNVHALRKSTVHNTLRNTNQVVCPYGTLHLSQLKANSLQEREKLYKPKQSHPQNCATKSPIFTDTERQNPRQSTGVLRIVCAALDIMRLTHAAP